MGFDMPIGTVVGGHLSSLHLLFRRYSSACSLGSNRVGRFCDQNRIRNRMNLRRFRARDSSILFKGDPDLLGRYPPPE